MGEASIHGRCFAVGKAGGVRARINLHNGDNMPALRAMADNAYSLAIVDPPYGIGNFSRDSYTSKGGDGPRVKNDPKWDLDYKWNETCPSDEYFAEMRRVSVGQIVWGANYYPYRCGGAVVWYKGDQAKTVSHAEIASLSFQNRVDYVHINWQPGFYRKNICDQIHPCQKPVALYKWLLSNYAKPGDTILDTHLGSGSIAIACWDAGYDLDAWELDADYYAGAVARLDKHKRQGQFDL